MNKIRAVMTNEIQVRSADSAGDEAILEVGQAR